MRPVATPTKTEEIERFGKWCKKVSPELVWNTKHLKYVRSKLEKITSGELRKLAISWPAQHWKTFSTTVRYPLWRMLRQPGLRVGIGTYNQRYANKVSRWTRRLVDDLGIPCNGSVDSWSLPNGSTYIARGAGVGLSGEPVDLFVCDDPFKNREEADSEVIQEKVWEWLMDDVTPRIQQGGSCIVIHTRWHPGDLIGRILNSEDAPNWEYVRLPALAEENDPLGRDPGEPLCDIAFNRESLEDKRRVLGIGFESIYQQNPIPRGGTFFERTWFEVVKDVPSDARRMRYWDLAASRKDMACYSAGILMAKTGEGESSRYFIEDVVRGQWSPADRNDAMLQTAKSDETRPGFERTWFECPVFDKDRAAERAIYAKLSGCRIAGDRVSGAGGKEIRAEPLADAAKAGLVKVAAAPWNAALINEYEAFPRGQYADQVDGGSGVFNKLSRPRAAVGSMSM